MARLWVLCSWLILHGVDSAAKLRKRSDSPLPCGICHNFKLAMAMQSEQRAGELNAMCSSHSLR